MNSQRLLLSMPSPPCPHGRVRYICKEGGGKGICEHGRQRSRCKECGGKGICEHGRVRSRCKECGGKGICEHGRERSKCKECGGSGICEHGRVRSKCKECGGGSICEHGRQRSKCKECKGSGPSTNNKCSNESGECHVCFDPFNERATVTLKPCGHMLHGDCRDELEQAGHKSCPVCGSSLAAFTKNPKGRKRPRVGNCVTHEERAQIRLRCKLAPCVGPAAKLC